MADGFPELDEAMAEIDRQLKFEVDKAWTESRKMGGLDKFSNIRGSMQRSVTGRISRSRELRGLREALTYMKGEEPGFAEGAPIRQTKYGAPENTLADFDPGAGPKGQVNIYRAKKQRLLSRFIPATEGIKTKTAADFVGSLAHEGDHSKAFKELIAYFKAQGSKDPISDARFAMFQRGREAQNVFSKGGMAGKRAYDRMPLELSAGLKGASKQRGFMEAVRTGKYKPGPMGKGAFLSMLLSILPMLMSGSDKEAA